MIYKMEKYFMNMCTAAARVRCWQQFAKTKQQVDSNEQFRYHEMLRTVANKLEI